MSESNWQDTWVSVFDIIVSGERVGMRLWVLIDVGLLVEGLDRLAGLFDECFQLKGFCGPVDSKGGDCGCYMGQNAEEAFLGGTGVLPMRAIAEVSAVVDRVARRELADGRGIAAGVGAEDEYTSDREGRRGAGAFPLEAPFALSALNSGKSVLLDSQLVEAVGQEFRRRVAGERVKLAGFEVERADIVRKVLETLLGEGSGEGGFACA